MAVTTWGEPERRDEASRRTVDDLISEYVRWMPGALEANRHDPQYRTMMEWMRRVLGALEMAMEAENIPTEARRRILSTAVYGGPDEHAARARLEERQRLAEEMASRPVSLTLKKGEMPDWLREALATRPPGSYPASDAILSETLRREPR